MKYLSINVKINIDDLYKNNYKIFEALLKKTRYVDILYHRMRKLDFVKYCAPNKCIDLV